MVPVMVEVGAKQGLRKNDLISFVKGKAHISDSMVGHVEIAEEQAKIEVHKSCADRVLRSIERATFHGKRLNPKYAGQA